MGCGGSKKISDQEKMKRRIQQDVTYLIHAHQNNNREARTSIVVKQVQLYDTYLATVKQKLLENNISVTQSTRYGYVDHCCYFFSVMTTTFYFSDNGS